MLYNAISRFFKKNVNSKSVAKNRLQLVLLGDRGVSLDVLEKIRLEFIEVLNKYLDIDRDALHIELSAATCEDGSMLVANIPVKKILTNDNN